MNDAVLDLQVVKQPLRALMYEKLIWTHLFGIHTKCDWAAGGAGIGVITKHRNGNRLTNAVRKLAK